MRTNEGEAYVLSMRELTILLAGSGADRMTGFFSKKEEPCDREGVLHCLQEMVQRQLLYVSGQDFRMEEGLGACIAGIRTAKRILEFSSANARSKPICVYVGIEGATLLEIVAEELFRVSLTGADRLFELLSDQGLLPPESKLPETTADCGDAEIRLSMVRIYNPQGRAEAEISILDDRMLYRENPDEKSKALLGYTVGAGKHRLQELLEDKNNDSD